MTGYLPEATVYNFLTNDFESAWNCLASTEGDEVGRGNFVFALQALILLEWAKRMCDSDSSGTAKADLIQALERIERRYFTPLPYSLKPKEKLLSRSSGSVDLIDVVFDLVRHGQAHQYHQIQVELTDGEFGISLGGAHYPNTLDKLGRPKDHLSIKQESGAIWLWINSGVLYSDIKTAIEKANLLSRGLSFPYIKRKCPAGLENFAAALSSGGPSAV